MKEIVVVGGGQAGAVAASTLRDLGFAGRLRLICEEAHLPYERPPLSKGLLRGEVELDQISVFPETHWAERDVDVLLGTTATRLVPGPGVEIAGNEYAADAVVLCPGATPRYLRTPGEDLDGVLVLRSVDHAVALRDRLVPGARMVVVGGGLIGSELASTASDLGCLVTVVDPVARPLARVLGDVVGERLAAAARSGGVRTVRAAVEQYVGDQAVRGVRLSTGVDLPADVVVVAVGAVPREDLARASGIFVDDGILVDRRGESSMPGVFVAGDAARLGHGPGGRVEHWRNAIDAAMTTAGCVLGQTAEVSRTSWFWTDQFGLRAEATADVTGGDVVVRGDVLGETFSCWHIRDERLVGVAGVGAARDVRKGRRLVELGAVVTDRAALADLQLDVEESVIVA